MGKGLPRSLSRGDPLRQEIVKMAISVEDLVVNIVGPVAAAGYGTSVIQGLPEGNILLLGAVANLQFAGPVGGSANLVDTWNGDFAIGSIPDANGALAGAEVDIVPSTAVGPAVAELSPVTRGANAVQAILDNTAGALELNLNVLVDDADITDGANVDLTVNGVLYIAYIMLGDD